MVLNGANYGIGKKQTKTGETKTGTGIPFINPESWIDELQGFKSIGFSAVGTAEQLKEFSQKTKRKWTIGITLKPQLE